MRIWRAEKPDMPHPESKYQALVMIHYARTHMATMRQQLRFYSHAWLRDHGLPSALPDHLRPRAERMYPKVIGAVGVASGSGPGTKGPFNYAVERVMSDAVLECEADGHALSDPVVKRRMLEKRAEFKRRS
jgi:hypothetical protein